MSDTPRIKAANAKGLSSRLQRRAPASLKISPVSTWNVAIPLLSPLATSPSSPPKMMMKMMNNNNNRTVEMKSRDEQQQQRQVTEPEKPVFKKWQQPPFCYEPAPLRPSFVPV